MLGHKALHNSAIKPRLQKTKHTFLGIRPTEHNRIYFTTIGLCYKYCKSSIHVWSLGPGIKLKKTTQVGFLQATLPQMMNLHPLTLRIGSPAALMYW